MKIFIALTIAALAGFSGVFLTIMELERKLDGQALAVERRKTQCMSVRAGLESARRNLLETNHERHNWGRTMFEGYVRDDWHLVNTCASEALYVEGSCAPDEQACMLHVLDWALVNIR